MGQLTDAFLSSQGIVPKNPTLGIQPSDLVEDDES